ncbi:MAG: hypothetical protein EXR73_05080, partial [Myxococcales bacterium]|nr:hypothetical protein [Myxococcales bacterium]
MRTPRRTWSRLALLALCGLVAVGVVAQRAVARPARADMLAALRALESWRFEEARGISERLEREAPGAPETLYLAAEVAFTDGKYARSLEQLAAISARDRAGP